MSINSQITAAGASRSAAPSIVPPRRGTSMAPVPSAAESMSGIINSIRSIETIMRNSNRAVFDQAVANVRSRGVTIPPLSPRAAPSAAASVVSAAPVHSQSPSYQSAARVTLTINGVQASVHTSSILDAQAESAPIVQGNQAVQESTFTLRLRFGPAPQADLTQEPDIVAPEDLELEASSAPSQPADAIVQSEEPISGIQLPNYPFNLDEARLAITNALSLARAGYPGLSESDRNLAILASRSALDRSEEVAILDSELNSDRAALGHLLLTLPSFEEPRAIEEIEADLTALIEESQPLGDAVNGYSSQPASDVSERLQALITANTALIDEARNAIRREPNQAVENLITRLDTITSRFRDVLVLPPAVEPSAPSLEPAAGEEVLEAPPSDNDSLTIGIL